MMWRQSCRGCGSARVAVLPQQQKVVLCKIKFDALGGARLQPENETLLQVRRQVFLWSTSDSSGEEEESAGPYFAEILRHMNLVCVRICVWISPAVAVLCLQEGGLLRVACNVCCGGVVKSAWINCHVEDRAAAAAAEPLLLLLLLLPGHP
jgi:hypothetical protein